MQTVPAAMRQMPLAGARSTENRSVPTAFVAAGRAMPPHLGVVVQIHAPGRLGKALVQHPLRLDAQGLQLRCRGVQPHRQIAVRLRREARPLGEGRQQRPGRFPLSSSHTPLLSLHTSTRDGQRSLPAR